MVNVLEFPVLRRAVALCLLLVGAMVALASPAGAHEGPEAPAASCPAGAVSVLVDASSEPDLYAAHLVAGVLDTGCVVDSGDRDLPDLPAASVELLEGLKTGYVLGGTGAVPQSKLPTHIAWSRIGGADRWETLRLAGRMATGEWVPPPVELYSSAEPDTASEIATAEAEMARWVNELRESLGLAPLAYNNNLASVARGWSETMRQDDIFVHNPSYTSQYPNGWRLAGENISWRQSGASILERTRDAFDGLVDSPGHYANMTHPAFNSIGIGVAVEGRELWVTQNFAGYP